MKIVHMLDSLCPLLAIALISGTAAGADRARTRARLATAANSQPQPTITILPAPAGASLQGNMDGSASLSLGRAAYFGGKTTAGVAERTATASMFLSTRFELKVDCGNATPSSLAEVTISLAALDPTYRVRLDGVSLLTAPSVTVLRCGSITDHVVEVEIPRSKPAGNLASILAFSVAPKY